GVAGRQLAVAGGEVELVGAGSGELGGGGDRARVGEGDGAGPAEGAPGGGHGAARGEPVVGDAAAERCRRRQRDDLVGTRVHDRRTVATQLSGLDGTN